MHIGAMRTPVSLMAKTAGSDANGEPLTDWTTIGTDWADVRTLTGLQIAMADGQMASLQTSLRLRYRADIVPGMRVALAGQTMEVQTVVPDIAHRRHVDLVCVEVEA